MEERGYDSIDALKRTKVDMKTNKFRWDARATNTRKAEVSVPYKVVQLSGSSTTTLTAGVGGSITTRKGTSSVS